MIPETKIHKRRHVSVRVSLRGMIRQIRIDTLHIYHNVCFLSGRLIFRKLVDIKQMFINSTVDLYNLRFGTNTYTNIRVMVALDLSPMQCD